MIKITNLNMSYRTRKGDVKALRDINFEMAPGDIVGLVGESGCGKSTLLLTMMRLIPACAVIESGEVLFQGSDILKMPMGAVREIRGKKIGMIFQDPMTTLNPVFKVGEQIREAIRIHNIVPAGSGNHAAAGGGAAGGGANETEGRTERNRRLAEERRLVLNLMREVEIPAVEKRYAEYPHEYSGGMQQRALIATALSCKPDLLLADEPTTALDVTVQAQIMSLLEKINRERKTAIILVTHDIALAAEFCKRLVIMYAGEIVEQGNTRDVIENPRHPYTRGLLNTIPRIGSKERIEAIRGTVPDLAELTDACAFFPRCDYGTDKCQEKVMLRETGKGRFVRCCRTM